MTNLTPTFKTAIIGFNYDSEIVYYNSTVKRLDFKTVTNGIKIDINTANFQS